MNKVRFWAIALLSCLMVVLSSLPALAGNEDGPVKNGFDDWFCRTLNGVIVEFGDKKVCDFPPLENATEADWNNQ